MSAEHWLSWTLWKKNNNCGLWHAPTSDSLFGDCGRITKIEEWDRLHNPLPSKKGIWENSSKKLGDSLKKLTIIPISKMNLPTISLKFMVISTTSMTIKMLCSSFCIQKGLDFSFRPQQTIVLVYLFIFILFYTLFFFNDFHWSIFILYFYLSIFIDQFYNPSILKQKIKKSSNYIT